MRSAVRVTLSGLVVGLIAAACAQPAGSPVSPRQQSAAPASPLGPTRITVASFRELDFVPYSAVPGTYELRNMVNPGLAVVDDRGALRPVLAEAVPTLENGLWKLFPDGRMETTWQIRPGALWHDGTALTADDLVFTIQVGRDRTTGVFGQPAFRSVEDVAAPDPKTITVTWSQPYIDADQMFTIWAAWPLPKPLLEASYLQDPGSMSQLPFWTMHYVGSGPYRLREYTAGLRISLEAFDRFALGRPRIDEIELAYTPDPSTVLATSWPGLWI
jgi:peptide/nickel transport system substrate-binding protein